MTVCESCKGLYNGLGPYCYLCQDELDDWIESEDERENETDSE